MSRTYKARKIVRGKATGKAIVINGDFSFLGGVDMGNGEIIDQGNPHKGMHLKDSIFIFRDTKGSSGASAVLMTLKKKNLAPAAIVTQKPVDYNLVESLILAQIPVVCEPDGNVIEEINTGCIVSVDADNGLMEVVESDPVTV